MPIDDKHEQYTIAIYFVTTTLSTCGFGDIYAMPGDGTESLVIFFLQFVGMLFYSMTIQKVQRFMLKEEHMPSEHANSMVERVENLIVKVGRDLPNERKISEVVINEWKTLTNAYFSHSPNAFLIEDENYKLMSEPMRTRLIKKNLMIKFQEKHDVFFMDPEFGFKADDKLVARVIACLQYEHIKPKKSILSINVVSPGIYFIQEGQVEIFSHDQDMPLLVFDSGSYFGDSSFIFKIRN